MIKIGIKNVVHEIDVQFLISENELKDVLQRHGQLSLPSKKGLPYILVQASQKNSCP